MKKLFLFSTVLIISFTSFGQIKQFKNEPEKTIGKVGGGLLPFVAELTVQKGERGSQYDNYVLSYRNQKFTHISSINYISFKGNQQTIDDFYDTLLDMFKEEKNAEKSFEFGKEILTVQTVRNLGVTVIKIYTTDRGTMGYVYLTKNQLEKLFNKN